LAEDFDLVEGEEFDALVYEANRDQQNLLATLNPQEPTMTTKPTIQAVDPDQFDRNRVLT
jgi:hypothetical protein